MSRLHPDFLAHSAGPSRPITTPTDGRPENSPAAIRAAIEAGYGIEMDVQLTADDRAMVFHDYDLERLTAREGPDPRPQHAATWPRPR